MGKQGAKELVMGWLAQLNATARDGLTDPRTRRRLELLRMDDPRCRFRSSDIEMVLGDIAEDESNLERSEFLRCAAGSVESASIGAIVTDVHADLATKVIEHFIWQVKRKMAGLSVDHHMMVILRGAQGAGKSTFVRSLLAPLPRGTVTTARLSELNSVKGLRGIAGNYVVLSDEMEGASRTDLASLKGFLTADAVGFRPMGSNGRMSTPQKATFIGCTNRPVAEQLRDVTGMRRFFEIECRDVFDHDEVNAFDFAALWRGVDHRGPSPIANEMDRIREIQNKQLKADPVTEYLDVGFGPQPMPGTGGSAFRSRDLYADFHRFCAQHGFREPLSHKAFTQELVRRGWTLGRESGVRYLVAPAEFVGRAA